MAINHVIPTDYKEILDTLVTDLAARRAHHAAWEAEEKELIAAIEAVKTVSARQRKPQLSLSPALEAESPVLRVETFRGLPYRRAVLKCFKITENPLTAPNVADMLFEAGYAKERKLIKANTDGIFKMLRDENTIRKVDDETFAYELVSNGTRPEQMANHPAPA